MPENKYDRPAHLKAIRMPGATTRNVARAREEFVRHIREGLADKRYTFGDILPTVTELRAQYAVPEDEIDSAIRELRTGGLLQLHDEYRDTYFLDPGADHHVKPEEREDLAQRVRKLEALCHDLAARVEALEGRAGWPGEARRRND
ncbi:GntR family transcriptional regulator [Streptomyces sp. SLBN-31]|uniref:GntR family transcriptional regulator n=1 Tax=Streptomyces sp. SLBN-31 TaxID=2768444 RepID=UPI0011501458|nr:GntR family transcriptional regulator [Streptomyces sp. SLBN-31]TQJ92793.1 regulatory GntR family protein [Streptomyces sp. SLBN-31]